MAIFLVSLAVQLSATESGAVTASTQPPAGQMTQNSPDADRGGIEFRETVDRHLPKLKSKSTKEREGALLDLHNELMTISNSGKKVPSAATRKQLAQELIQLYTRTQDKDFAEPGMRRTLLYDITRYGDNEVAKPFILNLLDKGSADERAQILNVIGAPGGVSGEDVYRKVDALAKKGTINPESRTTLLARIDKDKALPEILREVDSSKNKRLFLYSAWALQNSYRRPEDFKRILPRIKEFGLSNSGSFDGRSNGLFWIDAGLLASYIDAAEGADLRLALELIKQHTPLIKPGGVPVMIKKLSNPEPGIRLLAAEILEIAMGYSLADKDGIKSALRHAVEVEGDPRTKSSIQAVVGRIADAEREWQRMLERAGEK